MLQLLTVARVPADTMRVAKDAIPESNTCMALRDELSDSGFDYSILSRFRDRLIKGHAEMSLLDQFLDKCKSLAILRDRSDIRTDSTHVVASIRNMNRSEMVGETLRATLNVLSTVDPTWVAANVEASWYLKYARRFESDRQTRTKDGIIATAEEVGA